MATIDDVRRAYPGATTAIQFMEETPAMLRRFINYQRAGRTPRDFVDDMVALLPTYRVPAEVAELFNRVMREMQHPDFLKYVAAKLGAL